MYEKEKIRIFHRINLHQHFINYMCYQFVNWKINQFQYHPKVYTIRNGKEVLLLLQYYK